MHGCDAQLAVLHTKIRDDLARRPTDTPLLVHLGDYIDRGPNSAGVIARLLDGVPGFETVNLMGNHEHTALEAIDGDGGAITDWLHNGGRPALQSWGIDPAASPSDWASLLPAPHLAFLRGLRINHRDGIYLFVHAGIRPGIPLLQQSDADMLTIRTPFLTSETAFGAVVVHGHTPTAKPVVKTNRIGIDTGAAFGGALTCAVLEGPDVAFLQAQTRPTK